MRNRYYSTELGRFLTRDPIGAWRDILNSGNEFAYAANRPGICADPTGLLTIILIIGDDSNAAPGNNALEAFEHQLADPYADPDGVLVIHVKRDESGGLKASSEWVRPNDAHRRNAYRKASGHNDAEAAPRSVLLDPLRVFVCGHGNRDGSFPDMDAARRGLSVLKLWLGLAKALYGGKDPDDINIFSCYQGKFPTRKGRFGQSLAYLVADELEAPVNADLGSPTFRHNWGVAIDDRIVWSVPIVVDPGR